MEEKRQGRARKEKITNEESQKGIGIIYFTDLCFKIEKVSKIFSYKKKVYSYLVYAGFNLFEILHL